MRVVCCDEFEEATMRRLLLVVALCLLCVAPASADIDIPSPTDIMAGAFADGWDRALIRTADSILSFATTPGNDTNLTCVEQTRSPIVTMILNFASWSIMPFEYESVQHIMGVTFAVALMLLLMYVALGAVYCNLSRFTPAGRTFFHIMDGDSGSNRLLSNYAKNMVAGAIAMSIMPVLVFICIMFAKTLKQMAMMSIVDMIAPCETIPFLYLVMAIMWLLVSVFFGISNLVILITGAGSFLLGALYGNDRTRHASVGWFEYFFGCVVMQVLIVGGVVLCIAAMTEMANAHPLLWAVSGIDIPMYLALLLGATYIGYKFSFGKTKIISSSVNMITKVI